MASIQKRPGAQGQAAMPGPLGAAARAGEAAAEAEFEAD